LTQDFCALQLGAREIVTSDKRQAALARKAGLKAVNPLL
jgi:predicted nucleic acid-binding protein